MSTVKENRLFKVRELVEKSGGGTSFATRLGLDKQYVSQIAGKGPNRKGIGDTMARKIEREFSLPNGYLDAPPEQTQVQINAQIVRVKMLQICGSNENYDMATYKYDAVSEICFFRPWMRQHINAPDHDRVNVATVRTDKMSPTFTRDDLVLVDTSVSHIEDAGIYVFAKGGILYINRMQPMTHGVKVLSDNPHYESELFTAPDYQEITIYGRVMKWLRWAAA